MTAMLFGLSAGDVAVTSDDWYTPRWVFDAAGIVFDMDVAAPADPAMRTCPAREYLTAVEDGLTAPWEGNVWMNPPYKASQPWVDRPAKHPSGLALLPVLPEVRWLGHLLKVADAVTILSVNFQRPDGRQVRLMWCNLLAARGAECVKALGRIAAADKYAAGAYHVRPEAAP
jgi:hypothetical protein